MKYKFGKILKKERVRDREREVGGEREGIGLNARNSILNQCGLFFTQS